MIVTIEIPPLRMERLKYRIHIQIKAPWNWFWNIEIIISYLFIFWFIIPNRWAEYDFYFQVETLKIVWLFTRYKDYRAKQKQTYYNISYFVEIQEFIHGIGFFTRNATKVNNGGTNEAIFLPVLSTCLLFQVW